MTPRKGKPPTPEYQTQGPAPFSLYTPDPYRSYMAPRLTLAGKVPHRLASGVRR